MKTELAREVENKLRRCVQISMEIIRMKSDLDEMLLNIPGVLISGTDEQSEEQIISAIGRLLPQYVPHEALSVR